MSETASPLGLYVHIPFCVKKCPYCDFVSGPVGLELRKSHLAALEDEIRFNPWAGRAIRTLFFGGGTPSELTLPELRGLTSALRESFDWSGLLEWTIECNPGTVRPAKFAAFRELGLNRVSIGVQSFRESHLRLLGRIHDADEARQAYWWARQAGFDNVNLDLIFALPGQTLQDWREDLEEALSLEPEHLSLYNLTIEPGTEFFTLRAKGCLEETGEELAADMYELAMDRCSAQGLLQYEISNYALPGRECKHNLVYWRNQPYLGFGLGAASYIGGVRWSNTDNFGEYAAGAKLGRPPRKQEERLTGTEALTEAIMLGLRTREGIDIKELETRLGLDATERHGETIAFLVREGLLRRDAGTLTLTRRGTLLASEVCAQFL